jgi:hypothetical protein
MAAAKVIPRAKAHRPASVPKKPRASKKMRKVEPSQGPRFKNIPVHSDTYAKLSLYRIGSLSFNDVMLALMSKLSPEEFHREYVEWQTRVIANMDKSGDFETL